MEFLNSSVLCYVKMMKHGFDFKGVCSRGEYWKAIMVNTMIALPVLVLSNVVHFHHIAQIAWIVYVIVTTVPIMSITIRRERDAGWNPYWYMISFIPGAFLVLIYICTRPTTQGILMISE